MREYSRYFIADRYADDFAQGLLALERNWRGPLLANENVNTTLAQFQVMEQAATPRELKNWRFQQALYRAYYDSYIRRRLLYETELEERAMQFLREAPAKGSLAALSEAERILNAALNERPSSDWRARIFELSEALYQSIGMQLSVKRYKAISVDRGASLDTVDNSLNNRLWLKERFREIRERPQGQDRLDGIKEILQWTNPGPGGFYDDLGNSARQPHLVLGRAFAADPAFLDSPHAGFEKGRAGVDSDEIPQGVRRVSWVDHAESLNETPLSVRYSDLDPDAHYKIRVVYAGDSLTRKIRLVANDGIEIHPLITKPYPIRPMEFDLPVQATRSGQLILSWFRETGLGGNGRGCQVSELWLIKVQESPK